MFSFLAIQCLEGWRRVIQAMRRLVSTMSDDLVNLDFSNAYNITRRDVVLPTAATKMPELYRFVHSLLACSSNLAYGIHVIEKADGSQQGDPLSGLELCETIHLTLSRGASRTKLNYVDDFNLNGKSGRCSKER